MAGNLWKEVENKNIYYVNKNIVLPEMGLGVDGTEMDGENPRGNRTGAVFFAAAGSSGVSFE